MERPGELARDRHDDAAFERYSHERLDNVRDASGQSRARDDVGIAPPRDRVDVVAVVVDPEVDAAAGLPLEARRVVDDADGSKKPNLARR